MQNDTKDDENVAPITIATNEPSAVAHENNEFGDDNDEDSAEFEAYIIKQTVHSVTIAWKLIDSTDVYEIEKYHKRKGWEQVAWKSQSPAVIGNLEENFAYRLRIRALRYDAVSRTYIEVKMSNDVVALTLAAQPTTLCLHRAIKKGQQFLVKRILRRRPSLIMHPGPNGYLPLANAIAYGENSVVDVLLTAGASVHCGNPFNGRTPLQLAFFHGRLPVARILLNKKAQLEATDTNGMTACHFAIDANHYEMLKFGLENHANTEANDGCSWTLLMRAVVMHADVTILKLLVMHGAQLTAVDDLGQSCTDLARLYRNEEAAKYFEVLYKIREKKYCKI